MRTLSPQVLALMALLGACASNSPPPLPPLSKQTKKVLSVQLVLVPPPKGDWQFAARHESGTVVEKTGNGDTIEVELPPGPCSLRLTADGMVYERPLVLGNVGINEIWQLVGGHRL